MTKRKPRKPRQMEGIPNTNLSPSARVSTQRFEFSASSLYQGPIPHPTILKAYDMVLPGLSERIIAAWEKQTDHRISMEKVAIVGDNKRANWGLVCGTVIALAFLGCFTLLAILQKDYALYSMGAILVGLGSLVGVFIYGTNSRKQEREEKNSKVKQKRDQ